MTTPGDSFAVAVFDNGLDWPRCPITAAWLAQVGFRWRPAEQRWRLWLRRYELGLDIAAAGPESPGPWEGWLCSEPSPGSGCFLYLRRLSMQAEVVRIVEVLTGRPWPRRHDAVPH